MSYRDKHWPSLTFDLKAGCSVRYDCMKPHLHYDPNHVAAYMTHKSAMSLHLSLAAHKPWAIGHFDMTAALLHEPFSQPNLVYIRKHPNIFFRFREAAPS